MVTRRSALKRIALILGVGGAAATGLTVARKGEETFSLEGRGWRLHSREVAKGKLPDGERMLGYGDLYDANGTPKGRFTATYFGLPQAATNGRLASLEQHVFTLPGGSIMGSGMTAPGFETEDEFAIVGGTGKYAGARGTYVLRQSPVEFGGDGTATITFRLMAEGVS
jgi:hypothetical protein